MENFSNLMKQAKKMKAVFKNAQDALTAARVIGRAGVLDEEIKIEMDGHYKIIHCHVDQSLLTLDKKVLEELMAAATNDAITKVKKLQKETMGNAVSGFNLPMDMPFMSGEEE